MSLRLYTRIEKLELKHTFTISRGSQDIVPVVIGDNERTMTICERLLERGFYAQGIRHPSVPRGTARLRITPMATHDDSEIDALADAVAAELDRPEAAACKPAQPARSEL